MRVRVHFSIYRHYSLCVIELISRYISPCSLRLEKSKLSDDRRSSEDGVTVRSMVERGERRRKRKRLWTSSGQDGSTIGRNGNG